MVSEDLHEHGLAALPDRRDAVQQLELAVRPKLESGRFRRAGCGHFRDEGEPKSEGVARRGAIATGLEACIPNRVEGRVEAGGKITAIEDDPFATWIADA